MKFNKTLSRFAGAFCSVLLSNCFISQAIAANPPAQGPAASSPAALSAPASELAGVLQGTVDRIVAAENASLAADQSYSAYITAAVQPLTPYMSVTTHPNQPNQFYADLPFTVTYHVTKIQVKILGVWVPYPFDRDITQEVDLEATCEGWYTGSGTLTYTAIPYAASLVGDHGIVEEEVNSLLLDILPNYIDRLTKEQLANFSSDPNVTSSGHSCRSLGVATRDQGFPDAVKYDPSLIHLPGTTPSQQITVRVTKVHRLQVHDSENVPVYGGIEAAHFDFYAGFSHLHMQFPPMAENQTVVFSSGNTVETSVPPSSSLLVLIGNLSSGNDDVNADYNFVTFGSATNFGDGTHTLSISKHWTQPVRPGTGPIHAVQAVAIGYQITLEITTPASQGSAQ